MLRAENITGHAERALHRTVAVVKRRLRGLAVAVLLGLPVAGAALAAGTHPAQEARFFSTAVVLARPEPGTSDQVALRRTAVRLLEEAVALDEALFFPSPGSGETTANGDPSTGIVKITARSTNPNVAREMANTVAQQAARFAKFPVELDDLSLDPRSQSGFSIEPRLRVTRRTLRGPTAARVSCPPRAGCGSMVDLFRPFAAGVTYRARAFARSSTRRTKVHLLLGASPQDFSTGKQARLRKSWRPYEVVWTPTNNSSTAEVGLQTQENESVDFFVDAISVEDPTIESAARPSGRSRQRISLLPVGLSVVPARGAVEKRATTGLWALGGSGIGFAIAAIAGVSGWAASRRRRASALSSPDRSVTGSE